jgi:hypothetical protein
LKWLSFQEDEVVEIAVVAVDEVETAVVEVEVEEDSVAATEVCVSWLRIKCLVPAVNPHMLCFVIVCPAWTLSARSLNKQAW